MVDLFAAIFWIAAVLVVYPYLIYPPLLHLLAAISPVRREPKEGGTLPQVTLIVSAYNEEVVIADKLKNSLSLDYPKDYLEIIVLSDASSDRTDEIVNAVAAQDSRVRLVRQDERLGKTVGLNKAVEVARGELVAFSDANAMYEPSALRELVDGFRDPKVGYVVGAQLYYDAECNRASENEGLYWKMEMFLKHRESDYFSVVGGDGAIYAIRRALFQRMNTNDISDLTNPLQIILAGYRGLFNANARCYEQAGDTFEKEFRRRRRIVNRALPGVWQYGRLLKFSKHGRFIFMLMSHKVIRWFSFLFICIAWLANTALLGTSHLYTLTWLIITSSMLIAAYGAILDRSGQSQPKLISVLYYFYLINLAALIGVWDNWRGVQYVTWEHIRKT